MLTQASLKGIPTESLRTLSALVTAEILARTPNLAPNINPTYGVRPKIADFRIGQRVKFTGRGGVPTIITIDRINQKTCSGKTDSGIGWRVSPGLLSAA